MMAMSAPIPFTPFVMAGLVPAIHAFTCCKAPVAGPVDARNKSRHDGYKGLHERDLR
jgi:hypothetical protein